MRAGVRAGCQWLIVVSNWMPGSPQIVRRLGHLAHQLARVGGVDRAARRVTARVCHFRPSSTARMKSSVTRTEWFAFWKKTESYAPPGPLKPPS